MITPIQTLDLAACKVALVLNGASGKADGHSNQDMIRDKLTPHVKEFVPYAVSNGADIPKAAQQAVRDGADVVIALGGDGTQSAVAGALAGTRLCHGCAAGRHVQLFRARIGGG